MQHQMLLARYAPQVRDQALLLNLLLATIYVASAYVGLQIASVHPSVTGLWPPSGVALAALVLGGPRLLPGIVLGAAIIAYASSKSLLVASIVPIGNSLEALAGYLVLQQIPRFSTRLDNPRSVIGLVAVAVVAPAASALIGPTSLILAEQVTSEKSLALISTWWMGDLLGILLVTPLILCWWGNIRFNTRDRGWAVSVTLLACLILMSFVVFHGKLAWLVGATPALFFILPITILLALGEDSRLCALGNVIVAGFAIWGLSRGVGPFVEQAVTHVEMFLTFVGATALLVSALSAERGRALLESRRNLDRFQALTTLSADWYWETDAQHRFTFLSEPYESRSGLRQADTLGRARYEMAVNQFESQIAYREHMNTLGDRRPFRDLLLNRVDTRGNKRWASVSGEPLFDANGIFQGYRGVGRDVTAEKESTLQIEASQRFLDTLVNALDSPVLVKDEAHRYIAVNAAFAKFFARPVTEILGKNDYDFFDADKAMYFQSTDDETLRSGRTEYESSYLIDGVTYRMQVRKTATRLPDGRLVVVLIMSDITARRAAEDQLRDSEGRFRDFAQAAGDYAFEVDLDGRFTLCSSRSGLIWGYAPEDLVGHTPAEYMPEGEAERVREWLAEHQRDDGSFRDLEHPVLSKHGEERWILVNAVGLCDSQGTRIGLRGSARDITDRKTVEDRINFLATRDALTGLPNRVLFGDRITQAMAAARRSGQKLALCFMDLDRFKYINDTLGHDIGDLLLKQVAERMLACVRKRDTLARLGGDEFVLTLEGLQQAEDVAQVAGKIIRAISQPFEIDGHTITTSCSVGISIFPNDAEDERTLMKNADTAMYHAKERGRNDFQFFSADMNTKAVERGMLEVALRQSVKDNDFILHYQPRLEVRTSKLVAVEALLRWNHPERGMINPSQFIDVAEDCGALDPIGQWTLREACQCMKDWDSKGYPALVVAVNVAPRQMIRPNEFSRNLMRVLAATAFDPSRLELEVTESLLLHNADEIVSSLRKLARDGIRISVDDFGSGHASLSSLRQFPIKAVKVDRGLVRDVDSNAEHAAMIQAIVAMAHSLNIRVIAEAVETREQLTVLETLGCDEYQGNLFSRPVPAIDIAARFLAPLELDLRVENP
ncbi:MAG: EAL domain-containing protein [Betaproteobacteria bacterium]|nr:EAL domain-containing protein [Betaproteobacteria bacterium]